jgi:carboxylesterase type B
VKTADHFGPIAPQPSGRVNGTDLTMSEDCLFLNVWTPRDRTEEPLPVLFWIHGGGFTDGSGADLLFDGESIAAQGVIVVTVNYRLGVLGFLASPELDAESGVNSSGNYGLLDLIAALEWVKENINAFGGDPAEVTIAGQSAGAGAAGFLMMSPLARGLFRGVIAQSHVRHPRDPTLGYLPTAYRTQDKASEQGSRYLAEHHLSGIQEARGRAWQDLNDAHAYMDVSVETGGTAKPPLFRPVLDGWVLPMTYEEFLAQDQPVEMAYLAGDDRHEGGAVPERAIAVERASGEIPAPGVPVSYLTLADFRAGGRTRFGAMSDEFFSLYPAADDDEAARASNEALNDNARVSTFLWGRLWCKSPGRHLWTYFWTHESPRHGREMAGAYHGSEIEYVFGTLPLFDEPWKPEDHTISQRMSAYWANFVRQGNPNGPGLPEWQSFRADEAVVMEVGDHFAPIAIAEPMRFDFWRRYFETNPAW